MKRLLSLCRSIAVRGLMILLIPMFAYAQQCTEDTQLARLSPAMLGSTPGGCSSCTDTDKIWQSPNEAAVNEATVSSGHWRAGQLTTTETECVTGIYIYCYDGGNNGGITAELYTESAGKPGSIVGAGYTATIANLNNSTPVQHNFLFASTQTLSAGTYWVVAKVQSATITLRTLPAASGGTGNFGHSEDSGVNWVDVDNDWGQYYVMGLLGCL